MKTNFYSLLAACALCSTLAPIHAEEQPIDNVIASTFSDSNADGVFESSSNSGYLYAHWRNVNYLNQRYTKRVAVEVDLSDYLMAGRIEQAWLQFELIGTSNTPELEFRGYVGDGVLELSDAAAGEQLLATKTIDSLRTVKVDISDYARQLQSQGQRYLGINIRTTSEGKTHNTFDDEVIFRGPQLSDGLKVVVDNTASAPYTPANVLHQHNFGWGIDKYQNFAFESSRGGRVRVVDDRLRMDQTNYFSTPTLNQLDWSVNLKHADNVTLNFFQTESADEADELDTRFVTSMQGDGVSISHNGVDWYPVISAEQLDLGANGGQVSIDLDEQVARIEANHDSTFQYNEQFKVRFQQFGRSRYPYDGRDWGDLLITGDYQGEGTDVSLQLQTSNVVVSGADNKLNYVISNVGAEQALGVHTELQLPISIYDISLPAGCERSGELLTCFIGNLAAGEQRQLELLVRPARVGQWDLVSSVRMANMDADTSNNTDLRTMTVN